VVFLGYSYLALKWNAWETQRTAVSGGIGLGPARWPVNWPKGLLGRPAYRETASRRQTEAEAALHYAKVTKAANDVHADCLRIICRAEIRMADEIDRGQESGEVAVPPEAVSKAQTSGLDENPQSPATYEELGVSKQRVSEWREMQAAGEVAEAEDGRLSARTSGTSENQPTPATYKELGVSSQRVSEMSSISRAG
jgi:hypothetical protein